MVLEPDGATLRGRRAAGRGRPRVPGLERQLVPAHAAQDRARRRPLGRRHVPRGDRASRVDPRRLAEADRPPRRQRARAGSTASSPSTRTPRPIPRLDRLDTAGPGRRARQPERLAARHGPAAAHAQERPGRDRTAPRAGRGPRQRPQARVQAIWTLAILGGLDAATALGGPRRPASRRSAGTPSRRAEGLLAGSPRGWPRPCSGVADDPDPQVRLQLALALGDWNDPRAGQALATDRPPRRRRPLDPRGGAQLGACRTSATLLSSCSRRRASRRRGGGRAAGRAGGLDPGPSGDRLGRRRDRHAGGAGGARTPPGSSRRCGAARRRRPRRSSRSTLGPRHRALLDALLDGRADAGPRRRRRRGRPARGDRPARVLGRRARPEDRDLLRRPARAPGPDRRSSRRPIAAPGAVGRPEGPRALLARLEDALAARSAAAILDALLSRKAWTRAPVVARGHAASRPPRSTRPTARRLLGAAAMRTSASAAEAVFAASRAARAGGARRLPAGAGTQGRSGRRRRPSSSGSARPATGSATLGVEVGPDLAALDDKIARGAPDRDPRPEPGVRVAVRQLHRGDDRRPRPHRPDRQRDGQPP